jgi:hypothetical protein
MAIISDFDAMFFGDEFDRHFGGVRVVAVLDQLGQSDVRLAYEPLAELSQ